METNPETNRPIVNNPGEESGQKDQAIISEGLLYAQALQSPEGKFMLEVVQSELVRRAEAFLQNDPGCQGLLGILKKFGVKISAAEGAVNRQNAKALRYKE